MTGAGPAARTAPRALAVARRVLDPLLDLVFPAVCPVCRARSDDPPHRPFCRRCWAALPLLDGPACVRCATPFPGLAPTLICERCRRAPPPVAFVAAVAAYRDGMRAAIHALKYGRRPAVGAPLGALLAEAGAGRLPARPSTLVDALVPVPLHPARLAERGFNQAEILAGPCACSWGVPVLARALRRARATAPQTDLDAAARRANVAGAFVAAPAAVTGLRLLLVDDVLTTGATARAAAEACLQAGAARVGVLVLARVTDG